MTLYKNTIIGLFVLTKNHCVMVTSTVMTTSMAQPSFPSGNSLDSGGPTSNNTHLVTPSCNSNSVVVISPSKMKEEEKRLQSVVSDINVQTATFRDVLIHVGTSKDSPELREKIRAVRRKCVEDCKDTHRTLMPKIKSALADGTIVDNQQLICLYMLSQLLERELVKCLRLVEAIPMDMSSFNEPPKQKQTTGMGKLFSQLVINTTGTKPDFNNEEKASIEKDTRELRQIVREMAEYLPREDPEKARHGLTNCESGRGKWMFKKSKSSHRFLRQRRNSNNNPTSASACSDGSGDSRTSCMFNHVSNSFCCLCSTPSTSYI